MNRLHRLDGRVVTRERAAACAAIALATALGCGPRGGSDPPPPPPECLDVAGTWDVTLAAGCREVWQVAQSGCSVTVAAALPCPPCFLASPLCHGASGSAPDPAGSPLRLEWSWIGFGSCSYGGDLEASSDGRSLEGHIGVLQHWAPGGTCPGRIDVYPVTGTRR